jgi:hypothetical protein
MSTMISKRRSSGYEGNYDNSEENSEAIQRQAEADMEGELPFLDRTGPDSEELEDLETELGMKEVDLDQAMIDTIANDDIDDSLDADDDGIDDETEDEEIIDDRPQALTESYGTGLQGKPSDRAGTYSRRQAHLMNEPEFVLTGGDVDANTEDADAVGEEAVGGTVATPDQDTIEELAAAVGIQTDDRSYLRTNDMLEERDDRRWELDPESAEDYGEHRE